LLFYWPKYALALFYGLRPKELRSPLAIGCTERHSLLGCPIPIGNSLPVVG
jgi:hypothetical protein